MPCQSAYMDPNARERESNTVSKHLMFLFRLGFIEAPPAHVRRAAKDVYGEVRKVDEQTAMLCSACKNMTEEQKEIALYDGKNKKSRHLADWWERHQEADRKREAKEKKKKEKAKAKAKILAKLTKEERKILGV